MIEPNKCSKCGGVGIVSMAATQQNIRGVSTLVHKGYKVVCSKCASETQSHQTDQQAVAAWNAQVNG